MLDTRQKETVRAMSQHARGCKKMLEDCRVCRNNIQTYREFAADQLAILIAEPIFERRFGAIEQLREKLVDAKAWHHLNPDDHQADRLLRERARFASMVGETKQAA